MGLGVSECDLASLEKALHTYRQEAGDPELFGFDITRSETEVKILRRRNITQVRTDGDYRPMEE